MSNRTVNVGRGRVHCRLRWSRKPSCRKGDFELRAEIKNRTRREGWKGYSRQGHSMSKGKEAGICVVGSGCHAEAGLGDAEILCRRLQTG